MSGEIRKLMLGPLFIGVALGVVALGGCGGDGDESTAKKKVAYSEASEPPRAFAKRLAKLLETTAAKKDCEQLEQINGRSFTRFPCPVSKKLRQSMASFKVMGAKEYGTGAIVDYKSGAVDGAAIVLFVAPDRNWGIGRFGVVTKPSTKTSDKGSRAGYQDAVDKYLAAVRDRNCKAFVKVTFTDGAKNKVCKTSFAGTESLATRLQANPSAKPKYQGGNASYGFYTLETQKPKPENSTISIVKAANGGSPYVILDVTPTPTAAEQAVVREQLRQQLQRERNKGMEPSSKPSDPSVTTP